MFEKPENLLSKKYEYIYNMDCYQFIINLIYFSHILVEM